MLMRSVFFQQNGKLFLHLLKEWFVTPQGIICIKSYDTYILFHTSLFFTPKCKIRWYVSCELLPFKYTLFAETIQCT